MEQLYPDRIPLVILDSNGDVIKRMLVHSDCTVGKILFEIRMIHLDSDASLMLLTETNVMPCASELIGRTHTIYKNTDGFLYLTLVEENVFGEY